jgi:hypothetical protein
LFVAKGELKVLALHAGGRDWERLGEAPREEGKAAE